MQGGSLTTALQHVSGSTSSCPSSLRLRARQGREIVCVSAPMLMQTPRRASVVCNARLAPPTNSLSAPQAMPIPRFALCSDKTSRPLPPRHSVPSLLCATPSASPLIANEIGVVCENRFARFTIFRTRRASYRTSPWCIFRGGRRGSERNARQGGGGYLRTPRGQAPEPPKSLI